jgi:hypothetical protein
MKFRTLRLTAGSLMAALALTTWAAADAPPGSYFNGFEQNTAGWFNFQGGTIMRRPSGYTNSGGYADGISSATGSYHARLGLDSSPRTCAPQGLPLYDGPFTDWGGYSSIFPPGGYQTRVDIYLDVAWAAANFDRRFDWSSAVNNTSGMHRRDFIFNAGTEPTGFVISASNGGNRCNSFPNNPGRTPIHIAVSGWYTFEHSFTGVAGGPLAVMMRVIHKSTNVTIGTWALTDPSDIIGVTVGGNRYGWFVQNEIDDLAIDNSERTGILSTPGCEIKINDGGWITALNTDIATFGGNARVSLDGDSRGQQEYHDHGPVRPLTVNTIDVQRVVCSDDRTEASLFGRTTVDGSGFYESQIDLKDAGEPGTEDMYSILIPEVGYYSGKQMLGGGNVQIR